MAFDPSRGYHDNPLSLQIHEDTRAEINLISPIPILLVKIPPLGKSRTDAGGSVYEMKKRQVE